MGSRPSKTVPRGSKNSYLTDVLLDRNERLSAAAYWELLVNLTRREVKSRYSQSFFGFAWAMAQPLATMVVFTFVFSRLGQIGSGGAPYPVFAYAALVPWFFFSNTVTSGMMSVITYRNIVTKTYFPREIIPLAQVTSRFLDFGAAATIFVVMLIYYRIGGGVVHRDAGRIHLRGHAAALRDQRVLSRRESGRDDFAPAVAVSDAGCLSAGEGSRQVPAVLLTESVDGDHRRQSHRTPVQSGARLVSRRPGRRDHRRAPRRLRDRL